MSEMRPKLVVALVVGTFDGRFPDRRCYAFDDRFGAPMLNFVCLAYHVEVQPTLPGGSAVAGLLGELGTVIGQHRVDSVEQGFRPVLEGLPCCPAIHLVEEVRDRELAKAFVAQEQVELASGGHRRERSSRRSLAARTACDVVALP